MAKKNETKIEDASAQPAPIEVKPQAVVSGDVPDAWTETAPIAIAPLGYGELLFETLVETADFDDGEKPVDFIANLKGGRIAKFGPKEPSVITLELYPIYAGNLGWPSGSSTANADGVYDLFEMEHTSTTDPFSMLITSVNRVKVRMTALWVNDTTTVDATAAVTGSTAADRCSYADGYITKVKKEYTDGIKKYTVTLKFPPTDKDGASCELVESTKGGNDLAALSAYTTSNKFR